MISQRHRCARCARWFGLVLLAFGNLAHAAEFQDESAFPLRPTFPAEMPHPLRISIGAVLIDFAKINGREESFELQGYLLARWRDPSQAVKSGEPTHGKRRVRFNQIWSPNYDFVNALDPVRLQNATAYDVSDDGQVEQRLRFSGRFSAPLDLRKFPFDAQELHIRVEPFERPLHDVIFQVDPEHVGKLESAFLTDWTIEKVDAVATTHDYPILGQARTQLDFRIRVARRSTFYVWRVLFPLTLIVATSWGIFWFDPTQLQPQISTAVAILLNVVMFNYTVDFALPKVAYLTLIDSHAMLAYAFMLGEIFMVYVIHYTLLTRGLDPARTVQRRLRFAFPLTYGAMALLEVFSFL